jgi:hypothetical protein
MFNTNCGASVPLVANIDGNGGNNGMFGNDSWIGLIIILALLSGGFGGFGGFGGGFGGGRGVVEPCATKADLTAQGIVQKLDGITYGISDSTFALSNSINSGFHGVDNAICTLGYQNQQGFNTLGHQMSDCCCQTQRLIERGFADTNYNMATQACETRQAITDSTRAILDFLTTDKIATLQAENQSLKFKASQAEQNAYIRATIDASTAEVIRRTGNECPVPAYVVPNPNCCYNPFGFGYGSGYGSGCGCA